MKDSSTITIKGYIGDALEKINDRIEDKLGIDGGLQFAVGGSVVVIGVVGAVMTIIELAQ